MTWQRRLKLFLLFSSDILIFYAALGLTLVIRYLIIVRDFGTLQSSILLHFNSFSIIFLIWLIVLWIAGLYDLTKLKNSDLFYKMLIIASSVNAAITIAFFYFVSYFLITPKINLFIDLVVTFLILSWWRNKFNNWLTRSFQINIVFLGAGPETLDLKEHISNYPQLGYKIVAILAPDNIIELENLYKTKKVSLIISGLKFDHSPRLTQALLAALKSGIDVSDLDKFYESITGRVPVSIIQEIWFLENIGEMERAFYKTLKRAFDIIGALILGIVTLALLPLVALAIKMSYSGSIFYRQPRVGKDGEVFVLTKFRSIADGKKTEDEMRKPNEKEVTWIGQFLRRVHVDELPQVWNILRGHMSFIGPRPEKPDFVERLSQDIPFYEMRHLVKPGVTGWAQLNNPFAGPTIKDTIEKLQYDLYYIKNRSLLLDLKILFKTIRIALSGAGR